MTFYKCEKDELYNGGTVGYVDKHLSKKTIALFKRSRFFFDVAEVISVNVQKKVDKTHWLVVTFNSGATAWYDIDNDAAYGNKCVSEIYNLKMEGF